MGNDTVFRKRRVKKSSILTDMNCDEKKSARKADISAKRRHIVAAYEELWNRFITRWRGSRDEDAVWLTCSASYMLNTRGLKWAVDPYLLSTRLPEVPAHDVRDEYGDLSFVLLTHAHGTTATRPSGADSKIVHVIGSFPTI